MTAAVIAILCAVAGGGFLLAARLMGDDPGKHAPGSDAQTSVWLARVRATLPAPGLERRMAASQVRHAKRARQHWTLPATALVELDVVGTAPAEDARPWAEDTGSWKAAIATEDGAS